MEYVIWGSVALISFLVEIYSFSLIFIWVCLGSISSFVARLLGYGASVQITVFTLISVLTFLIGYNRLQGVYFKLNRVQKRIKRYKGKLALCTEPIVDDSGGKILYFGSYYKAISNTNIAKGSVVRLEDFNKGVWSVSFVNFAFRDRPIIKE